MILSNWEILPLEGKYYGTRIAILDGIVTVWLGGGSASEREIERGWTPDCGLDHTETEVDLSTAQLIAAAPDLYAALQSIVDAYDDSKQIEAGRKALAKARGES